MKKIIYILMSLSLLLCGCSSSSTTTESTTTSKFKDDYSEFVVTHTGTIEIQDYGTLEFELYGEEAPLTVQRFVEIVEDGGYYNSTFHRIVKGFMMQGGEVTINKTYDEITGEFTENGISNYIKHKNGTMSFCRTGAGYNTGTEQFFICCDENEYLDGNYAAFGYITNGVDIVDDICETLGKPSDDETGEVDEDLQPVITKITVEAI